MPDPLPQSAEIVVIGGGIVGCSTAYPLAPRGKKDVIRLERSNRTSGTTWHSAAQVRQLRSSSSLTTLMKYSAELYQSLEAETGQATGWMDCGSLSIAANPDRMHHIRRQASLARAFGIAVEEVDAAVGVVLAVERHAERQRPGAPCHRGQSTRPTCLRDCRSGRRGRAGHARPSASGRSPAHESGRPRRKA